MTSKDNVDAVTSEPTKLVKFYEEPSHLCESLIKLPLPHAEVMRQSKYFDGKRTMYCSFIEKVKGWLSEVGHPYVPLNKDLPAQNVTGGDSASNVSRVKTNSVTSHFQLAWISSTWSAHPNTQADKAALMECAAALKKKHLIETQEEKLRREKEQLNHETKLTVTNAKLQILELSSSQCDSKLSDSLNSYLRETKKWENPNANIFVPEKKDEEDNGPHSPISS